MNLTPFIRYVPSRQQAQRDKIDKDLNTASE
jgi:hypothetical protein